MDFFTRAIVASTASLVNLRSASGGRCDVYCWADRKGAPQSVAAACTNRRRVEEEGTDGINLHLKPRRPPPHDRHDGAILRQNENLNANCNCREKLAWLVIFPKVLLPNDVLGP